MTKLSEKFCLKWKDFQQNILSSYQELRRESEFSDVSLVCEDEYQIEAHRIILTACSPFFSTVLKRNKNSHPMIYMRGVKAKDLVAIVDFIYHGEANMAQEDLNGFFVLAEELQLKGLTSSQNETGDVVEERQNSTDETEMKPVETNNKRNRLGNKTLHYQEFKGEGKGSSDPTFNEPVSSTQFISDDNIEDQIKLMKFDRNNYDTEYSHKNNVIVSADVEKPLLDANTDDLNGQIYSMMERVTDGDYKWKCTECGKTSKSKQGMSRHIETHIKGISYPCNQCGAVKR